MRIACDKAGDQVRGSVLASDAYFPFTDGVEAAAAADATATVQPGGSKKDDEVSLATNRAGLAMHGVHGRPPLPSLSAPAHPVRGFGSAGSQTWPTGAAHEKGKRTLR
jgi:hypothetical protein